MFCSEHIQTSPVSHGEEYYRVFFWLVNLCNQINNVDSELRSCDVNLLGGLIVFKLTAFGGYSMLIL